MYSAAATDSEASTPAYTCLRSSGTSGRAFMDQL